MKTVNTRNVPKGWGIGPDKWLLSPHGAIYHADEKIAVIADLHLGYTETRGRSGDCIPAVHDTAELRLLNQFLHSVEVRTLIIAGDILESPLSARGGNSLLDQFTQWLDTAGVNAVYVSGNHDPAYHSNFVDYYELNGWCIHHGHLANPSSHARNQITGHLHPVIRMQNRTFKTFLVAGNHIILPAFSQNAAGVNFLQHDNMLKLTDLPYYAWLCSEKQTLNFGLLSQLLKE